jgi:hypothetical protein
MRLRNLWQLLRGAFCREKRDDHEAHDEGRSLVYDAKKCNAVSAQFSATRMEQCFTGLFRCQAPGEGN